MIETNDMQGVCYVAVDHNNHSLSESDSNANIEEYCEENKHFDDEDNERNPPEKRLKINRNNGNKYSAPTNDELNNMRETEALFHSSLFRFQLDEMLMEVQLKDKWNSPINKWLKQFESLLKSLKSIENREITDQLWLSLKIPIIQEPFNVKGKFRFEAPKLVKVIGSYDMKIALRPKTIIDIAIEIPSICWQKQDNLNQRYHRKRALYLCSIAQQIQTNEMISDINFAYFNGNHMKPVLLIKPKSKIEKYCTFCLFAYPQQTDKVFKAKQFTPEKNNVRSNWLLNSDTEEQHFATPYYNASILNDMNMISNCEHVLSVIKHSVSAKDSLILLKIWLKQRDLRTSFSFILTMFVCYLLETRKISKNSSCYQIFRSTLSSIVNSKWESEGITMAGNNDKQQQSLQHYFEYFPVVFIDLSGYHNLCWEISIDLYERLKHESKLTLDSLDSDETNSFESAFMKQIDFEYKFDALLHISVPSILNCPKAKEISNDIINFNGDTIKAIIPHLILLFKHAVGHRIYLIQHKAKSSEVWPMDCLAPHPNDFDNLTFGFLINVDNAYNSIDRGPDAESDDAKDFRLFWSDKSELRRFQDGSICETVYWKTNCFADKRAIIMRSLQHIINTNLSISSEFISITLTQFDEILELQNLKFQSDSSTYGTGEEASLNIIHSFDTLAKKLRNIEGLPLSVTSVQGISSAFRATDVFPPLPMNGGRSETKGICNIFGDAFDKRAAKYFKPLEVILQLEGSGKWPNEINALNRVKASFYIELSKCLSSQFGLITYASNQYLDIFQDGFIFRIIIACHKEISLLRQIKTSEGTTKRIDSEDADKLEIKTELYPKINSAINGLNQKYQCYGITCRLAKRWLSSQFIAIYFDDIAIELIVAQVFINSSPFTVPNSPIIGFIRFLCLICSHNWKISPLIVNLNEEMDEKIISEIQSKFTRQRPSLPPMFISSPYDLFLSMWTKLSPSSIILNRLLCLANAALKTLLFQIKKPLTSDFKVIFRHEMEVYDIVIHLKHEQITNSIEAIDFPNKFKFTIQSYYKELNEKMPIVDFDPIAIYLDKLRSAYSEFALFFYDKFGGKDIGVLFKPGIFKTHNFKVSHINCSMLSSTADKEGKPLILTNIEAIIEDFKILGQGILNSIETRSENWQK